MTILSTKVFGGEVPRIPADKLPDGKAQQAVNCDFAYGELRPNRGLFEISRLANNAKSIFSLDGLTFFSWPHRAKPWKGPVTNDAFNRCYFLSSTGDLRVARTADTRVDGGEPAVSYKVGVPKVTAAPTATLVPRTSYPEFPHPAWRLYTFYEADGKRYDEKELTNFTMVSDLREVHFVVGEASPLTAEPTDVSETARTLQLASITYSYFDYDRNIDVITTTLLQGAEAVVLDSKTVRVGETVYYNVVTFAPLSGATTTPGNVLSSRLQQAGAQTPTGASLGIRVELYDTERNVPYFSVSAMGGAAASRTEAVPGGLEISLAKNGDDAYSWKLLLNWGVIEARAYVVTMVNQYNEESAPSAPVLVQPTYIDGVKLTFAVPNAVDKVPLYSFRVYRSVSSGDYLSCTSTPVVLNGATTVSFTDENLTVVSTDAVLESVGWDEPPTGLQGLNLLPNGFFAAFSGDTMYFSEPYRPWAWPYAMTFPINLIGARAIESSLVVTTTSFPFLVNGVHPDAMTQSQLTASQAGVSDHGMAVVGGTVAYISNDGLAVVKGYEVDLSISQQFWTREVWKQKFGAVLSDLELAYHDGSLVCSSPTGGKMWELRLDTEGGGNLSMWEAPIYANAAYVLPASDQLYLVRTNKLYQYRGGIYLNYDWWSKDYILPTPSLFTAGYINTDGQTTLTVYADGQTWFSQTFYAPAYFRLPSGNKALKWSMRLQGTGVVKELSLASRRGELRAV